MEELGIELSTNSSMTLTARVAVMANLKLNTLRFDPSAAGLMPMPGSGFKTGFHLPKSEDGKGGYYHIINTDLLGKWVSARLSMRDLINGETDRLCLKHKFNIKDGVVEYSSDGNSITGVLGGVPKFKITWFYDPNTFSFKIETREEPT